MMLRGVNYSGVEREPMVGVEPATYGLQNRCSAIELHRRVFSAVRPCGLIAPSQ